MRYVSGGDLHSVVEREGPLPPERVVALISPIASALDAAHRAGIVHRDIKPANVLVDVSPGRPDHPYLSDFGLAKRDTTTTLTSAGEFIGTAGFAAPEQIDGRPARFESDQYALACVVFTLLTRRLPFRSSSPEAVLWAQMSQPPPRVTPSRPELPAAVDEVLAQALAKNPADRFPDCAAFIGTLDRVLAGGPQAGRTVSRTPPAPAADPGRPSFPLPARNAPLPEAAPRQHRGRGHRGRRRGARIAAIGGAVVVVAAASTAGTLLLVKPGLLQSDFSSPASSAPSGPKVTATLIATLRDPSGQSADSAAFGSGGTLRIVDKDAESAYTFALASQRVTGHNDLGVLASNGGLLTPDAQSIVSPSSGCLPGGLGPCTYQVFQYNGQGWDVDTPAGSDSPVAVGESSMAITTGTGDAIQVWNLQTLAPVATVTEADDHSPSSIALSPDGGTVAAVSSATGATHPAYVWNVTSAAAPTVLSIPGNLGVNRTAQGNQSRTPLAVAGSTLAASDGLTTDLYHLGTQQPVTTVPADLLALSPDGSLVATSDRQRPATTDLRSAATGQIAASLAAPGEQNPPTSVVFSADGRSVAVSYEDGLTRVWRISESQTGS
jgi:hypothetical protein